METAEVTLPVQVLFATSCDEGIVIDAVVTAVPPARRMLHAGPGEPFSLLIRREVGPASLDRALVLLHEWAHRGTLVVAVTSATAEQLVLRHEDDELQLSMS